MSQRSVFLTKSIFTIIAVLFIIALFSFPASAAPPHYKDPAKLARLYQNASADGAVRVIVKLDVPDIDGLLARSRQFRTSPPGLSRAWAGGNADRALSENISYAAEMVQMYLSRARHRISHVYKSIPYMALEVSPEALAELEMAPEVLDIEEDVPVPLPEEPVQPAAPAGLDQPLLNNTVNITGASNAWSMGYTGAGWYVAVLDTGIRSTHEMFAGKTIVEACYSLGWDGVGPTGDCPNGLTSMIGPGAAAHFASSYTGYDHGTHVSGIAAGQGPTISGVAKDANIIAVQVFSRDPSSTNIGSWNSDCLAGLDYVYSIRGSYSIASVNMSLGGSDAYNTPCDSDVRKAAIDNLSAAGIASAIATGNAYWCGSIAAPACISSSVAVGASSDADVQSSFSNWHPTLQKLFAPGANIYSSTGGSDSSYQSWNGTSMATPHVTGAWALIKQAIPGGSVTDILTALQNTGVSISTTCSSPAGALPRIQIDDAITALTGNITVLAANGGESWKRNSRQYIRWNASGCAGTLKLTLWQNGGLIGTIADNVDPEAGVRPWVVGAYDGGNAPLGTGYTIKIEDNGSPGNDESDAAFSIVKISVKAPNGDESWQIGSSQSINWVAKTISGLLRISLFKDSVKVGTIASNIDPALGTYSWTAGDYIGGTAAAGSGYFIQVREIGTAAGDRSDSTFTLTGP